MPRSKSRPSSRPLPRTHLTNCPQEPKMAFRHSHATSTSSYSRYSNTANMSSVHQTLPMSTHLLTTNDRDDRKRPLPLTQDLVNRSQKLGGKSYSPLEHWESNAEPHEKRAVVGYSGYSQHGTEIDLKRNERGYNGGVSSLVGRSNERYRYRN